MQVSTPESDGSVAHIWAARCPYNAQAAWQGFLYQGYVGVKRGESWLLEMAPPFRGHKFVVAVGHFSQEPMRISKLMPDMHIFAADLRDGEVILYDMALAGYPSISLRCTLRQMGYTLAYDLRKEANAT